MKNLAIGDHFISDVCSAWLKFSFRNPVENYGNEIIRNNTLIGINNEIVLYDYNVQFHY